MDYKTGQWLHNSSNDDDDIDDDDDMNVKVNIIDNELYDKLGHVTINANTIVGTISPYYTQR